MPESVRATWGPLALRGAITVAFGLGVLLWPRLVTGLLVTIFGAYAVVNGLLAALSALAARHERRFWWLALILGVASILVGLAILVWPQATVGALLALIGVWAILTGAADVASAVRLRSRLGPRAGPFGVDLSWLQGLSGVASLLFGLALLLWADALAGVVIGLVGGYGLVTGMLLLIVAWRLRGFTPAVE